MKKPFILFFGVGWAGTTSLQITLQKKLNYLHTGHTKENFYLDLYFNDLEYFLNPKKFNLLKSCANLHVNVVSQLKDDLSGFNKNYLMYKDTEIFQDLSLENYINYYIHLSECCSSYQAVGDFSNTNANIKYDYQLKQIKSTIESHFDIKCLIIFRDPIRRLFSNICSNNLLHANKKNQSNADYILSLEFSPLNDYAKKVNQLYRVFGKENVCYLIMEDFFDNNKDEVCKLEQFLEIDIPDVYPCAFVPDKGINAPKIKGLQDQYQSDTEILTPEFYNFMRTKEEYIRVYSEFETLHGRLPANWGSPIDYGY